MGRKPHREKHLDEIVDNASEDFMEVEADTIVLHAYGGSNA